MRRFLMILPAIVGLAACAGGGPPPQLVPTPSERAGFPPGSVIDVIRVDTVDPLPLRVAELVAPDGTDDSGAFARCRGQPAHDRRDQRDRRPVAQQPDRRQRQRPAAGRQGTAATYRSESEVLLTISTADIALPDPVAYRRDWPTYRIRLSFGAPGNQLDLRELPAPEPPPEARAN